MQGQTFVFFGIAGSGKGTQMELLKNVLKDKDGKDCVYTYPGGEYRKLVSSGSYTGNLIKDSMERGELQPDFLTTSIVTNILTSSLSNDNHLIADGYPRSLQQSRDFEAMMKFYARTNIKIIYIEVGKEEAMKRNLARGRSDDTQEGIAKRFDEYVKNVVPSMNYFEGKEGYEVFKINGEQDIEHVHQDIIKSLGL